jgi:hypothetical protein
VIVGIPIGHFFINLWQKVLVILTSTSICESEFSKQNVIKSYLQSCLKLDTLDVLMSLLVCGIEVDNIEWRTIFDIWCNNKDYHTISLK